MSHTSGLSHPLIYPLGSSLQPSTFPHRIFSGRRSMFGERLVNIKLEAIFGDVHTSAVYKRIELTTSDKSNRRLCSGTPTFGSIFANVELVVADFCPINFKCGLKLSFVSKVAPRY